MKTHKELMKKVFALFGVILLPVTIMAVLWGDISQKPEITVGDAGDLSLDAILADAAVTSGTITVPAGRHALNAASDRTLKAGVTLRVLQGAVITIPTGRTFILAGPLTSGLYEIFNCVGTGKAVFHGTNIDMFPEWWGAKGDGSDDLIPFNNAITSARASLRANIWLSQMYTLSDTWSINDINSPKINVIGKNMYRTGITSQADGYPAIELIGAYEVGLSNFNIVGNNPSKPPLTLVPSVAIMMGRSTTWSTGGDHHIHHIWITGYFQYGEVYGRNCSMVRMDHIFSVTQNPAGGANKRKFAFCWCHDAYLGLTPRNVSFSKTPSDSNENNHLSDSAITHIGDVPADCAFAVHQKGGCDYNDIYVQGPTYTTSDMFLLIDASGLSIKNFSMESQHRYTFNIQATAPGSITGGIYAWIMGGSSIPTGAFLKTDANTSLSQCQFIGGPAGSKVDIGGGANNCKFEIETLTSFVVAGTFIGNYVLLPVTCGVYDTSASGNCRENEVLDLRATANRRYVDGTFTIGGTPVLQLEPYTMIWAASPPSSDSWAQGSVIWNTGVAAGGPPGWSCVKSNTFGTLNSGMTTGDITADTKSLVLNSASGLYIGNFIDIAGVTGTKRVTNINGTTITIDSNANATVVAAAVSFHNETTAVAFKAMSNVAN